MFAKIVIHFLLASLASGVISSPVSFKEDLSRRDIPARSNPVSFNNWGGFGSLNGFDNFYGVNNFDGFRNNQVVVIEQQEVVCRVQQIEIIQQQLVIIQEMAKRIITEQICEVEVQTIVFEQFHSGVVRFRDDLNRRSGRQVGFDRNIAGQFRSLVNNDGSFNNRNFGFSGSNVGNSTVVVGGNNWKDNTSPASVGAAFKASQDAINNTKL